MMPGGQILLAGTVITAANTKFPIETKQTPGCVHTLYPLIHTIVERPCLASRVLGIAPFPRSESARLPHRLDAASTRLDPNHTSSKAEPYYLPSLGNAIKFFN